MQMNQQSPYSKEDTLMKIQAKRLLACLLALAMLISAAPIAVLAAGEKAATSSSANGSHRHTKVVTVKKATFSKDGLITTKCSDCQKVLSKKTIAKIDSAKLKKNTFDYTGKAIKPAFTVKDKNKKALKKGSDYTFAYLNNVKPGLATVRITFKGNYSGTKLLTFKITPAFNAIINVEDGKKTFDMTLTWNKVNGAVSNKVSFYNGKKLVKTVKTTKSEVMFSKLSPNTGYSIVFSSYNFLGQEILSTKESFKTPKLNSDVSAPNAKEAAALYNKAINTLKNEKNVLMYKSDNLNLSCTDCSVSVFKNSVNKLFKSISTDSDKTITFKNGKGNDSKGQTVEINDFVSPAGRKSALTAGSIKKAEIEKTSSGGKKITIVLKKESATFNGLSATYPIGNFAVADPVILGTLDFSKTTKINSEKTTYTGTTLRATLNKNGKLTKLKITMPFESVATGKFNTGGLSVTIEAKGALKESYDITY